MNDDACPVHDPARRRLLGTLAAAGLAGVLPRVHAKRSRPLGVALVGEVPGPNALSGAALVLAALVFNELKRPARAP